MTAADQNMLRFSKGILLRPALRGEQRKAPTPLGQVLGSTDGQ